MTFVTANASNNISKETVTMLSGNTAQGFSAIPLTKLADFGDSPNLNSITGAFISVEDNAVRYTDSSGDSPTNVATIADLLDNAAAVDAGGGLVTLPVDAHVFTAGQWIEITNTTNYDGVFEIVSIVALVSVTITSAFTAETFAGTETITTAPYGHETSTGQTIELISKDQVKNFKIINSTNDSNGRLQITFEF